MKLLLVEPSYYTRYPALGLLKLATYHRSIGNDVRLVRGTKAELGKFRPSKILVTSLFTYSWRPVHEAVKHYKKRFPKAEVQLGGIYATLLPKHAKLSGADVIHPGPFEPAEMQVPAYDLVPDWDQGLGFSSRGCIRKCPFCAVPKMEPEIKSFGGLDHILIEGQKKVVLWDNNIFGVPGWESIIDEIRERNLYVDFNQAMDARLITPRVAEKLKGLKIRPIRMAYDVPSAGPAVAKAADLLEDVGFRRDRMIVYTMFNFLETPEDFFHRIQDLMAIGVVAYPMRYEPLDSLKKNEYVSPYWTPAQLEKVAIARRVLGNNGAFPSYLALVEKMLQAKDFDDAFSLRTEVSGKKDADGEGRYRRWLTPTSESIEESLSSMYAEPMNDPSVLRDDVQCRKCDKRLPTRSTAFLLTGSDGGCVGFICADCHPNKKWVWALWRRVLEFDDPPVKIDKDGQEYVNLALMSGSERTERIREFV